MYKWIGREGIIFHGEGAWPIILWKFTANIVLSDERLNAFTLGWEQIKEVHCHHSYADVIKMSIQPKFICRFNAVPNQNPWRYFFRDQQVDSKIDMENQRY